MLTYFQVLANRERGWLDMKGPGATKGRRGISLSELPDILTVEETIGVLRLGRNSVYEGIRRGEIPAIRIGRRLVIPKTGIERLLNRADR